MSSPSITKDLKPPTRSHFHSASTTPSFVEIRSSEPIHAMERVQATSRPCHYNRFPIRFVRRPPPSGTPPGLEQKCQPQTALMNWRCDELDEAIASYMKRAYNLMIGERTAEEIKIKIGSAYPVEKETSMEVKGRDLVAGLPKTLTITSQEVREALLEPISTIVESVRVTLERCPPELSADLVDRGLVLAGGGALLRGLDKLLQEETGLPVHVAEDPLSAVAEGTGRALSELKFLRQVASSDRPAR